MASRNLTPPILRARRLLRKESTSEAQTIDIEVIKNEHRLAKVINVFQDTTYDSYLEL